MTGPTAVSTSITVEAPVERAFSVFTEDMASWWPADHHIIGVPLATMVFEPKAGGDVYDVGEDGSRCRWARVLTYEPPTRVVFSWDISLQWQVETDPTRASEVEVRFVPEGDTRTRVELEHRHLERHGDGWEGMRDAVGSTGGWNGVLGHLVARLQQAPAVGS
ncbi:MAG TPA: SRPBCC family protein [Acidimicrobiales bacterium]|nr:SRPBCC family protein [Acidimicrobiales bacterium]